MPSSIAPCPRPLFVARLYRVTDAAPENAQLSSGTATNDCDLEPVGYEFFTQTFMLHEEIVVWTLPSRSLYVWVHVTCAHLVSNWVVWCNLDCIIMYDICLCKDILMHAHLVYFLFTMFLFHKQDLKAQIIAILEAVGTLQWMNIFGVKNRDTLTHKTTW